MLLNCYDRKTCRRKTTIAGTTKTVEDRQATEKLRNEESRVRAQFEGNIRVL